MLGNIIDVNIIETNMMMVSFIVLYFYGEVNIYINLFMQITNCYNKCKLIFWISKSNCFQTCVKPYLTSAILLSKLPELRYKLNFAASYCPFY